jgi:hypothetical protein
MVDIRRALEEITELKGEFLECRQCCGDLGFIVATKEILNTIGDVDAVLVPFLEAHVDKIECANMRREHLLNQCLGAAPTQVKRHPTCERLCWSGYLGTILRKHIVVGGDECGRETRQGLVEMGVPILATRARSALGQSGCICHTRTFK